MYRRGADASVGVILFRLPGLKPEVLAARCAASVSARDDWEGRFSVVEPGRIRMRALPLV